MSCHVLISRQAISPSSSVEDLKSQGVVELPGSLNEALDELETDAAAFGWLGSVLGPAYVMHKRGEIGMTEGIELDELCRTYAKIY